MLWSELEREWKLWTAAVMEEKHEILSEAKCNPCIVVEPIITVTSR